MLMRTVHRSMQILLVTSLSLRSPLDALARGSFLAHRSRPFLWSKVYWHRAVRACSGRRQTICAKMDKAGEGDAIPSGQGSMHEAAELLLPLFFLCPPHRKTALFGLLVASSRR